MNMKSKYVYMLLLGVTCGIAISWLWLGTFSSKRNVVTSSQEEKVDRGLQDNGHSEEGQPDENVVKMTPEQAKKYGIKIQTAGSGNLVTTLSTRGKITLHPDKLAHILPKIAGVSHETRKNLGDHVEQGEILAVLESREMAEAKASYIAAIEKEKLSTSLFERETLLNKKKITAEQEFLSAKSANQEAKNALRLAQQQLHTLGLDEKEINDLANNNKADLRLYEIRSPIAGTVINRHMTKGEYVESTMTLFEVADLNTVWVEIGIYPRDLLKVKEGEVVNITLPEANMSAQAKLIYLSPIIQEETITARAIAELSNPKGIWRPGTYVRVDMASAGKHVPVMIPRDALQSIDSKDYVFIKTPEGFEKRLVEIGQCDNDNVEIISGLKSGEEYAATETFLLKADLGKSTAEHED